MSPRSKSKHGWASLETYLNAHDRVLRTYTKFMDQPKQYRYEWANSNYLVLKCHGIDFTTYSGNKVRVDLYKDVDIDDSNPKRLRARTSGYSYNANRPGVGNLIRYDSPDLAVTVAQSTPFHHQFHHKHDWTSGVEQIIRISDDNWPHVHEFLNEVLSTF